MGDRVYWGKRGAWSFRGAPSGLPDFLSTIYREEGITDQILFGDRRPVHRPAVERSEGHGVRTHVFEEGYFRPYWVTLEREGVNGHSLLPRDPDWFREAGKKIPDYGNGVKFRSTFKLRAAYDVFYHLAGMFNPLFFPGYRTHSPVIAPLEYAGYLYRFSMLKFWKSRDAEIIDSLIRARKLYYVLPLQLNSDAQIRDHSRFENMMEVIDFVMASFARHAPVAARLVIKNHPLDMGLVNYQRVIDRLSNEYGLRGRIDYLESGNLDALISHSQGTITVNSTVGAISLGHDCPTVTLSDPIYNLLGLTFQGGLDAFWRAGEHPDLKLFRYFRNVVIHTTQVNGGFYSKEGIDMAVVNSVRILAAEHSPLEKLL